MPICSNCEKTEFDIRDGSFFCKNCGVQCTDIIDESAYDDLDDSIFASSRSFRSEVRTQKRNKGDIDYGSSWITFEAFNTILKKQVDSLIDLGVPHMLKPIVLQLWFKYLETLGVAKMDEEESGKDLKCSAYIRKIDQPYFTSVKRHVNRPKRKFRSTKKTIKNQQRLAKRRLKLFGLKKRTTKKKELEDLAILSQGELSDSSGQTSASGLSASGYLSDETMITDESDTTEPPLKLWKILSEEGKKMQKCTREQLLRNVNYMKMRWTLSFLYLALLMLRCKILLSDLIRLTWTGHVPFRTASFTCIPMSMKFQAYDNAIFRATGIKLYSDIQHFTQLLSNYLGISKLPCKSVEEIVARLLIDFDLPRCLFDIVRQLMAFYPERKFRGKGKLKKIQNYEGRAAAFIILTLKLLFGLDGRTEWSLDRYCEKLEKRKLMRLFGADPPFKWGDWMLHTLTKQSIINGTFIRSLRNETKYQLFRDNQAGNFHREEGYMYRGRHCMNHKKQQPTDIPEVRQNILFTINSLPKQWLSEERVEPPTKPTSFPFSSEFREAVDQMKDCDNLREQLLNKSFRTTSIAYVVRSMGYGTYGASESETEMVTDNDYKMLKRLREKYSGCFDLTKFYNPVTFVRERYFGAPADNLEKNLSHSLNWLIGLFAGFLEMTSVDVFEQIFVVENDMHRLGRKIPRLY